MNWLKKLLFWRKPEPRPYIDVGGIVQKTLSSPETQRKLAENVARNNSLFQHLCAHDWKVEEGQDLLSLSGVPWFVCPKCGKRENTL